MTYHVETFDEDYCRWTLWQTCTNLDDAVECAMRLVLIYGKDQVRIMQEITGWQ